MPIEITKVGGSGPRDEDDGGTANRLRQLSEVLLTIRSKFLGFAKMIQGRLGNAKLERAVVSALGELVALLDSYEIRAQDTRLTNPEAKLGTDLGIQGHYEEDGLSLADGAYDSRVLGGRPSLIDTEGVSAEVSRKVDVHSPLGRVREREREMAKDRIRKVTALSSPRSYPAVDSLCDLERELLEWVCLSVFAGGPERERPGLYADRALAFKTLEKLGYVAKVKEPGSGNSAVWKPTPAGFEASGFIGNRKLEMDP